MQQGPTNIVCTLYEDAERTYPALEFLIDQSKGDVKVTSKTPSKLVDLDVEGLRRRVSEVSLALV